VRDAACPLITRGGEIVSDRCGRARLALAGRCRPGRQAARSPSARPRRRRGLQAAALDRARERPWGRGAAAQCPARVVEFGIKNICSTLFSAARAAAQPLQAPAHRPPTSLRPSSTTTDLSPRSGCKLVCGCLKTSWLPHTLQPHDSSAIGASTRQRSCIVVKRNSDSETYRAARADKQGLQNQLRANHLPAGHAGGRACGRATRVVRAADTTAQASRPAPGRRSPTPLPTVAPTHVPTVHSLADATRAQIRARE